MLKYIFAFIFALGILLVPYYKPTIVYDCTGPEMFPTYYGCPFIYKVTSLGSSLEFDFFFLPFLVNLIIWMACLLLFRLIVYKTILKNENKITKYFYVATKILFTLYCLFWITISFNFQGYHWQSYFDFEKEAQTWGMTCKGRLSFKED